MSSLTVTGKIGPSFILTTAVFNNVVAFIIVPSKELITITFENNQTVDIDISGATTMTVTITTHNQYVITIA